MKEVYHATLGAGGRLVIPAALRQALRLKEGDPVVLARNGEVVRIASHDTALKEVRAYFQEGIPDGVRLAEELLAERREEGSRD
jgi:AbrB family looped-hinge helix DNA binding protein